MGGERHRGSHFVLPCQPNDVLELFPPSAGATQKTRKNMIVKHYSEIIVKQKWGICGLTEQWKLTQAVFC